MDKPAPEPERKPSAVQAGAKQVFTTFQGEEVEIGSSWKRLVAGELQRRRIRWRYRAFDFPLSDRSGREVLWTPDFFIYDEAPKLVRVIAIKGTDADTTVERSRLFKAQYPGIAVEVWGREKLTELGLLAPAPRRPNSGGGHRPKRPR